MFDPFGWATARLSPTFATPAPAHPGWPEVTDTVTLADGTSLRLRPLTHRDFTAWSQQRILDEAWLRPVEPTQHYSWEESHSRAQWRSNFSNLRSLAARGVVVPMVIEVEGKFAGQVTIGNIQHGAISEAWIGYWVHSAYIGRGVATAACALGTDLGFRRIGLHRLTATFLPSNPASGKVLENCGYRQEGFLHRNLHIDGHWQDHYLVAQVADDFPDSAVARLTRAGRLR